jgi:predicted Zn-dependent protease
VTASFSRHKGVCGVRAVTASALVALAVALSGCTGIPALPSWISDQPPKQAEAPPATQREHARILAAYGGAYDDPNLENLISQTVERLVAASERPEVHYKVTILNSPAINAFALPTGQLYVTRGLAALANDDAELASVLSHEMAHVIARHAALREDRAKQAAIVDRVVHDVVSDPQTAALALNRTKGDLASFSRAQELEADAMGVAIAARAGFDPYGAVRFLTSMERYAALKSKSTGADSRSPDFLASHPATPDRIKNAMASARQNTGPNPGEREKAAYLASLDGLVYGEDPSEGFVRGRAFQHPKLGFTFTAPRAFALENTAHAVLGLKDGGDEALRLDIVKIPAEQSLSDYLTSGWIENVDRASVEELTLNGFPAATATAKTDEWSFRLYAVRWDDDAYRFVFATKHTKLGEEADRSFRESVETFRHMTAAEIAAAKPLRLQVVTVEPSDTIERLAARMVGVDHATERFRVLNGLEAVTHLKPGDHVKIVIE